jgi:hypothetical protein
MKHIVNLSFEIVGQEPLTTEEMENLSIHISQSIPGIVLDPVGDISLIINNLTVEHNEKNYNS